MALCSFGDPGVRSRKDHLQDVTVVIHKLSSWLVVTCLSTGEWLRWDHLLLGEEEGSILIDISTKTSSKEEGWSPQSNFGEKLLEEKRVDVRQAKDTGVLCPMHKDFSTVSCPCYM